MWYGHMTSWPNASMFLFALSLFAILGVLAWAFAQRPGPAPEEILRMRFARGEIDETTFKAGLEALRRTPPAQHVDN